MSNTNLCFMEVIAIEKKTLEVIEEKVRRFINRMDAVCGGNNKSMSEWMDNADVCQVLNISKRTLQSYRDNGTIPYAKINHKMFYRPSDVKKVLERYYHKTKAGK